jgi:outer membrane receptor protein involved in Fe transport
MRPIAAFVLSLLPAAAPAEESGIHGLVRDPSGALVADASVALRTAQGAVVASTRTDSSGAFHLPSPPARTAVLVVEAPGFAVRRHALDDTSGTVEVVLQPDGYAEEVTVTATPGRAEALAETPQQVNVITRGELDQRVQAVVAQAAQEEPGIHLQRTSPTMGGIFVRGLTGTKVNVYLDGVRYTTSAQRGGVSTFFNLIEPESLETVEVLRGPSSAEYGSDALGGSIQFLSESPGFTPEGRLSGRLSASGGSADASFGSSAQVTWSSARASVVGTLAGRRGNTLRPGGGFDSHNAVTRFLGLPSRAVIGPRLPDTAFTQYGGRLRANWALTPTSLLSAAYLRSQQDGGKRYDQLLGGDGNLVAELKNLMADHAFVRWERLGAGTLARLSAGYSFAAQREERVNQGGNGNPRAAVNHEPERLVVHGLQASALFTLGAHALTAGLDGYVEAMAAPSFGADPQTGAVTVRRGRVPDGASYRHGGVYVQDTFQAAGGRLRLDGAVRLAAASYEASAADAPLVNGRPLWPSDSYDTDAVTFRAGALWHATTSLSVAARVSRGFRAPDVTDLGTFGLTGSGYEVSNREVEGLGATVGSTADARAVSTGEAVAILAPETSLGYEGTLRYAGRRARASLTGFLTDIDDNVAKQALILPPGAVGTTLAGEPITRQLESGVVFVGLSSNPVLVRANFDRARLFGFEGTVDWQAASAVQVAGVFTYVHAEDRGTGRPPNIEGGTPAPDAWLKVRFAPGGGKRYWIEPYLHAAARQQRLSTLDLDDRRIGGGRSRASIASFFNNGARARGLVGAGPDGRAGTADDVLLATGETLAQVQDRVLGPGVASAPLYAALPGYGVFGLRGVVRLGQGHELFVDFENIADHNYRGISWGLDAPGRGVFVRYSARF